VFSFFSSPALHFRNWFWIQGLIFGLWLVALTYTLFLYMYFYDPEPLMERYRKPGTPGENTIGKRSKSSFNWILRADRTPFIPWRYLMFLGGPLLLGSIYGFIIGLLMSLSLVLRIIGEEKMLTEELEG